MSHLLSSEHKTFTDICSVDFSSHLVQTSEQLVQCLLTLGQSNMSRSFLIGHLLSQISTEANQLWTISQVRTPSPPSSIGLQGSLTFKDLFKVSKLQDLLQLSPFPLWFIQNHQLSIQTFHFFDDVVVVFNICNFSC